MPQVSPLDLLYARRQILAGDYLAGTRFGFLRQRRDQKRHAAAFEAAFAALERAGQDARAAVETALDGQVPRTERRVSDLLAGLDALNAHFRKYGPPMVERTRSGCRPVAHRKHVHAA